MERVTVRMARSDRSTPWGFGVTEAPDGAVVIVNIVGGSLADRAGLRNGDVIDRLEDLDNLDINAVDRLLVTAHEKIELVVTRNSSGPARIWRPEITENTGNNSRPYSVNLQHSNDSRPPQGFNNSALPFETDSRVKHMQYNSPLGLYSDKTAAEQYVQQTAGYVDNQGARATASNNGNEPAYMRSETLRLLKEQENGHNAAPTLSSHPNPSNLPICFVCSRPILGVMARAAGRDLHADCLACATCGNSLRNVGHHFIDEKFYCDIHGSIRKTDRASSVASPSRFDSPSGGARTVHYHPPKTQGLISPSHRGVPTATFGADLSKTTTYGSQSPALSPSRASARPGSGMSYGAGGAAVAAPPPPSTNPPPLNGGSQGRSTFERTTTTTTTTTTNNHGAQPQHQQYQSSQQYSQNQQNQNQHQHHQQTVGSTTVSQGSLNEQRGAGGRIPYCEACQQPIRGAFVLATGKSWCPEHFVCANSTCRRRLLECGFVEERGEKFCEGCFEQHIAPRCAKCSKPIVSDCLNALQKKWHPTCFTCAHCQKPFGNSAFYLEQGLPYCEQDWNALFTTKCVSCRYPIEAGDRWVEALGNAFHSNCFTCTRCNHNLEGESFFAKNGQPFCKLHA